MGYHHETLFLSLRLNLLIHFSNPKLTAISHSLAQLAQLDLVEDLDEAIELILCQLLDIIRSVCIVVEMN